MTGREEYDRNMTGRQDDRQRILDEYMIDYNYNTGENLCQGQYRYQQKLKYASLDVVQKLLVYGLDGLTL